MKTSIFSRRLSAWIGNLIALGVTALGIMLVLGVFSPDAKSDSDQVPSIPQIPAIRATPQDMPDILVFTGHIEAVHRVELRPRVSGPIVAVNYIEGSNMRIGDPLFEIDPRPYQARRDQAEADLNRAQAAQVLAVQELDRTQRLYNQHAVSLEDFERKKADLATADAWTNAAAATLRAFELDLEFTTVHASVDGVAGRAFSTVGDYVEAGTTHLATLVSTNPIHVVFDVDEPAFHRVLELRTRTVTPFNVQLVVAGVSTKIDGTVDYIDNLMNPSSGTAQMRAVLQNPDNRLIAGMFVRVELQLPSFNERLLVPETALGSEKGSRYLLIAGPDKTVEKRRVTLGARLDSQRVITAGLEPDEVVLLGGHQWLQSGMPVEPMIQGTSRDLSMIDPHL